jgi:acetylornithine deacetylase/succinyl-diaminopimelate desuccinylase-like protein
MSRPKPIQTGPRPLRAILFAFAFCIALSLPRTAPAVSSAIAATGGRPMVEQAPPSKPIDYDALAKEATELLQQYVRINTTDPPGNELPAAELLKEKFLSAGIPATIWQPQKGRGIIAARLHGIGHHTKALVLLSHMDVVPADPKQWAVPPFAGDVKDGYVWGRGTLDDKGPGVIELMAMLAIKRSGVLLDRDILFVATGDEEVGGKNGAGWFVKHEPRVFADAGYLLNEGGAILVRPNGRKLYAVSVTEKTPLWLGLTAEGKAGHAAVPPEETSVTRLVAALGRLDAYHPPIRVINPVRDYYKALAQLDGGPSQLLNITKSLRNAAFAHKFLAVPRNYALLRNTFTPTVLSGSDKTNMIPAKAYAEIDGRLLPGEDPDKVLENLRKVIADDHIKTKVLLNFPSVSSPRKSQLMNAIDQLAESDDAMVVPTMIAGFTDSHYFRAKGLIAYGFIPIELSSAEEGTVHGVNERIQVKQLKNGIRRMVKLLELFGGR